jgi:hypothetical protein
LERNNKKKDKEGKVATMIIRIEDFVDNIERDF